MVLHVEPSPAQFLHLSSRAEDPNIKSQPTGYNLNTNERMFEKVLEASLHKMKEIKSTHLTLTIDAYIIRFIVTSCSIRNFCFMSVIESFTAWHTIQFAWIRCL